MSESPLGYSHPLYAASYAELGEPRHLPRSGGWILQRAIPGNDSFDAMGCYPLFACRDWRGLEADLAELADLVCLSAVTDPLGDYTPEILRRCFGAVCIPFKQHFVADLTRPREEFVASHHRRNARKALALAIVEEAECPATWADDWVRLYGHLIERHSIDNFTTFSPRILAAQLRVPGMHVFRALVDGAVAGMALWLAQGNAAYYHLAAYNDAGYRSRVSFALFWSAFGYFAERGVMRLSLGAGAGVQGSADDGLTRFKQGWSTGTKTVYLCGRILDESAYARLAQGLGDATTRYFPQYRSGEFG